MSGSAAPRLIPDVPAFFILRFAAYIYAKAAIGFLITSRNDDGEKCIAAAEHLEAFLVPLLPAHWWQS